MLKGLFFVVLLIPFSLHAQNPSKKPLTANDYAGWKSIGNPVISATGGWIAYELNPEKGDGQLLIYNRNTGNSKIISRGKRPGIGPADDFVVFMLAQPEDTLRKAKLKKVKKEEMPKDSLGILLLKNDSIIRYPRLKSFGISEENATWVAFITCPESPKDTSRNSRKKIPVPTPGDDLILFNTRNGDTLQFKNVTEFACSRKGGSVYFIQQKKDSLVTLSSVKRLDTKTSQVTGLFSSEGFIKKITTDPGGENYSFLFSKDTAEVKTFSLFLGKVNGSTPHMVAGQSTPGMPKGWSPSENGPLYFSEDASKVYTGTAPSPVPEPKDTILEEDKPRVDIWNWKDLTLQSQQKVNLEKEKKRSFLAVYHIDSGKFVQLADSDITRITTIGKGNGSVALGEEDKPYQRERSWTGRSLSNYYLIDIKTGSRQEVLLKKEIVSLSPSGKYVIWYEPSDSSYYVRSVNAAPQANMNLTRNIPVKFYDEKNDIPDNPRSYGIAGWSAGDKFVFLYDLYDIWKIDPSGRQKPVCTTMGLGRKNHLQFRYVKTDPEEEFIPSGKLSLLSVFDTETMAAGYYSCDFNSEKDPQLLIMSNHRYGGVRKAKNEDRIIWTQESVTEFPDLWTSNLSFSDPQRISSANPQQTNYNWLTVELVEWKSFTGEILKGLLYKPENFNPAQKYPMMVYYYERYSEELNHYQFPSPSRSTINRPFYCSNGYLVFVPDITYRTGYPGQSAYDAVISGVYALAETHPYVDLSKMGLQGQSWGGYQTAYLITRTDLFAAAMAGAPVSNMTSAYGGIRWETGVSRMFQYEHQQSRIGGSLWDKPLEYIENSPLFSAPKVNTPLLIMHNDNDGAVPWYQGIEFFTALRRLNKPVWMLTYNGEPHNLKNESWANRMDLDKRMFQFFNHFLKGDPMPEWMEKGIPATEKGKNLGY